jgi:hypothetical protein
MPNGDDPWAEIDAARDEIRQSPGAVLYDELAAVARSYRLFVANTQEFERFLGHFDTDVTARLELWDERNRQRFEAFLDEVDRLLHNYLAAASTVRDHTRRLWQQHPPADAAATAEYERRVRDTFAEAPLAQFVQRLRNYSMHSKLPIARGQLTWSREHGDHSTVVLSKEALFRWNDWNAPARRFIETADENIDLRVVVRDYTAIVHDFNQWYGRAFVGGHLPAFDDLMARNANYAAVLQRLGLIPQSE